MEQDAFFINFSGAQLSTVDNVLTGLEIFTTSNPKTITIKGSINFRIRKLKCSIYRDA